IADAVDLELSLEAVLHTGEDVGDLRARHTPLGARGLRLVARFNGDLPFVQLDQDFVVQNELQFALRSLRRDRLPFDSRGDALRYSYRFIANTRHLRLLASLSVQPIRRSGKALRRRRSAHALHGRP